MQTPLPGSDASRHWAWPCVLAMVLGVLAMGIAAFLSVLSFAEVSNLPGCGPGVHCDAVLASRWSRLFFVPVSLLALGVYGVLLVLLVTSRYAPRERQQLIWTMLMLLSGAVTGSALWFTFVQAFWLKSWCPWCMASHVLGITIALVLLMHAWRRAELVHPPAAVVSRRWRRRRTLGMFCWGILLAAGLASAQTLQPISTFRIHDVDVARDLDQRETSSRQLVLLDGRLTLDVAQLPHVGPLESPYVIVQLSDYACPHCRDLHQLVMQLRRDGQAGRQILAVSLPMGLGQDCNPHLAFPMPEAYDRSCAVAEISLALWRAMPQAWPGFDLWLWAQDPLPPLEQVRAHAAMLVGERTLAQVLADGWPAAQRARHVQAYADSEAERLPIAFFPGKAVIVGRIDSTEDLRELMEIPEAPLFSR